MTLTVNASLIRTDYPYIESSLVTFAALAAILCVLALALIAAFAVLVAASLVRDHHAAVEAGSREPVGGFRPTSTPRDP